MSIKKVIIPAAGFGTRFLPFTKVVAKELLPLLNKPAIDYIVQEAHAADLNEIFIITSKEKQALRDYFHPNHTLDQLLQKNNRSNLLHDLNNLIDATHINFIDQPEQRGLGDALLMARTAVGGDHYAVILPDDIICAQTSAIEQLLAVAHKENALVVAVQEVPRNAISAYGSIAIKKRLPNNLVEIDYIVEKPKPEDAPSCLAVIGRYILGPSILDALTQIAPHAAGEVQLTDALSYAIKQGIRILALPIDGMRFDIGSPPGWLAANAFLGKEQGLL